jgi:hypothetical protein
VKLVAKGRSIGHAAAHEPSVFFGIPFVLGMRWR